MSHDNCEQKNNCEHEIKYCKGCDVAYCIKCNREWGKTEYIYQQGGTGDFPYINPLGTPIENPLDPYDRKWYVSDTNGSATIIYNENKDNNLAQTCGILTIEKTNAV